MHIYSGHSFRLSNTSILYTLQCYSLKFKLPPKEGYRNYITPKKYFSYKKSKLPSTAGKI